MKHRTIFLQAQTYFFCTGLATFLMTGAATAETTVRWTNWRGPNGDGSAAEGNYPVRWDATNNLLWKVALPGKGCSTPIVWDGQIFLTAPVQGMDAVLAFDWNGKELWRTRLGAERAGKHRNGSGSNASPITDGQSVFVYFKSGTLAALDLRGKVLWQTNLVEAFGRDTLYWDHGTSPVLTENHVVMARMHQGESWLAAFDKITGEMKWKTARNYATPPENDHGYNTPLVIRHEGREALLTWGAEHLTIHAAADGKLTWSAVIRVPGGVANLPAVATPVLVGDIAVLPFGRSDRGSPLLYGIKLGKAGELDTTGQLWKRTDTGSFVPSPVVSGKNVCLLRDRGEVDCVDPLTGNLLWQETLPKAPANYYASPAVAGGKLYAAREDGVIFVAEVGGKFSVLAENKMGERVVATPVLLQNRILVRGEKTLFCLGAR